MHEDFFIDQIDIQVFAEGQRSGNLVQGGGFEEPVCSGWNFVRHCVEICASWHSQLMSYHFYDQHELTSTICYCLGGARAEAARPTAFMRLKVHQDGR
eukprot:SAG31_NODE_3925_length_3746_cov_2.099260_1_plen_98_part_00